SFSTRLKMDIQLVEEHGVRNRSIAGMLFCQILELVKLTLIDDCMIFDPSHRTLGCFHLQEPATMFQNFQLFSIGHFTDTIRNHRDAVAQIDMFDRNVNIFPGGNGMKMATTHETDRQPTQQYRCEEATQLHFYGKIGHSACAIYFSLPVQI